MDEAEPQPIPCPRCGSAMSTDHVRTALWHGDTVAIVEDIPAYVCSNCSEQFYSEEVSDALHDLAAYDFPADGAGKPLTRPVVSVADRTPPSSSPADPDRGDVEKG